MERRARIQLFRDDGIRNRPAKECKKRRRYFLAHGYFSLNFHSARDRLLETDDVLNIERSQ